MSRDAHLHYLRHREYYLKYRKKYYHQHKAEIREKAKVYAEMHREEYREYFKKYRKTYVPKRKYYKRKHNGYFLYNDTEEKFFLWQKDAIKFLQTTQSKFRELLDEDIEINGWKGEEAL